MFDNEHWTVQCTAVSEERAGTTDIYVLQTGFIFISKLQSLTELLQQDVLEPLMCDKLHPGVQYSQDVVGVLGAAVPSLEEGLNFS